MYNEGFTKEELVSFKSLIQANIYKYLAILLEGRERFEEEDDDLSNVPVSQQLSASPASSLENSRNSSSTQAGMISKVDFNSLILLIRGSQPEYGEGIMIMIPIFVTSSGGSP